MESYREKRGWLKMGRTFRIERQEGLRRIGSEGRRGREEALSAHRKQQQVEQLKVHKCKEVRREFFF